ncbi:MAG TPA: TetR/AcrR family transcriptional regulator [Kineosporiaceae bacterium]|nr:TetR/AcrR family transcriptional regulator [Kineosporiaceae bacterium]
MSAIPAGGRRERVRAATVQEIKATARRLLAQEGPQAVTLRAIAREMGMTAPGLYRYFPSHEDLWEELCHDTYGAMADALEEALAGIPGDQVELRLLTAARRFRSWAVEHPRDFGLAFGMPLPGLSQVKDLTDPAHLSGMRFALVFTRAFGQLWSARPFPVLQEEEIAPALAEQLRRYRDAMAAAEPGLPDLPLGVVLVFLQAWVQLYGVVTMEVFGHLGFCLTDVQDFFEAQLTSVAAALGITRTLPGPTA